jgi:hypothetical protein
MTRVPFLAGQEFSLHHKDNASSGTHLVSYSMDTGLPSSGVKQPGHKANHSPSPSAMIENARSYTSIHQYIRKVQLLLSPLLFYP